MATVGLLYNLGKYEPPDEGEPPDAHAELDGESTVLALADAIKWGGHEVVFIEGDVCAYAKLREAKIDLAFNICEGLRGESRESHIPAILEMLGIPYVGSGVLTLAVALDKPVAKKIFAYHGIPTPKFRVFEPQDTIDCSGMRFPLFVKPAHEGSSMGVTPNSKVNNEEQLVEQVRMVWRFYKQAALVEEFLTGREFTVGIIGNRIPWTLPIMEINFGECPADHGNVYSRQFKDAWSDDKYYLCPAPVDAELEATLKDTAIKAYTALGCRDFGRVDLRLDADGIPNVLEINPLPGMAPGFSDFPRAAEAGGLSYNELVCTVLDEALKRLGLNHLIIQRNREAAEVQAFMSA
ncbi:MAG TPA: ATP-grasp domain-containing protein [Firmicutes bacterium]|nr:ATP-grasp domain-containing protein [Bacillota bacterium]